MMDSAIKENALIEPGGAPPLDENSHAARLIQHGFALVPRRDAPGLVHLPKDID